MSVHVANDPFQAVSVHYVRDSGVLSVEVLDSQLPKHWTLCQQMGNIVILRLTELAEVLYRAVTELAEVLYRAVTELTEVLYRAVTELVEVLYRAVTELVEVLYRAVKFAKMIVETSMASLNLSGRMKVPLIGEGFMVQAILSIMR